MARRGADSSGAPAASAAGKKRIRITQVKSVVGFDWRQRRVMAGLGLSRPGRSVVLEDTPSVRGMAGKVPHLVRVEEVES